MKITLLKGSPKEIAVAGTLGCTSTKSSAEILTDLQSLDELSRNQKCENVLKNSFGRGHGAVGDQANFTFSLSDATRLTTLFLCQSPFVSFLQQSMRHVKAGGYRLPEALSSKKYAKDVVEKAFELYFKMVEGGIPEEDARYILPLCSTTNIQMNVNARGLCQLSVMARSNVGSEARRIVAQLIGNVAIEDGMGLMDNYGPNYESLSFYPAPDLFGEDSAIGKEKIEWEKKGICLIRDNNSHVCQEDIDKAIKERNLSYLSFLKHIHFDFGISLSLAAFHQAVRQRTWDHCVETLENAISQPLRMVIPLSINDSKFKIDFINLHCELMSCCDRIISEGIPKSEAFNLIPHSLKIYDLIHINGWNAIHSLGKRCCTKSQWEIRGIANKAKQIIEDQYPELGRYVGPQCLAYGVCPESKPCGMVEKFKKERK